MLKYLPIQIKALKKVMLTTNNIYPTYLIIVLEVIILICIIIGLFQFIDIKISCEEYFNYKKHNYNCDIETYKEKIVELMNENDELKQVNNSLIEQLNSLQKDLDKLENAYFEIEHDNEIIMHNYIISKEKKNE